MGDSKRLGRVYKVGIDEKFDVGLRVMPVIQLSKVLNAADL